MNPVEVPVVIASEAEVQPQVWHATSMWADESWRLSAPPELMTEADALCAWAAKQAEPIAMLRRDSLETPAIEAIAHKIRTQLVAGGGVAWLQGLAQLPEPALRLLYLKMGLALGDTIDTYGRLYDVRDTGVSYKSQPVPVSLTREATGIHTDSSAKAVLPRWIGLACVRQAEEGGTSRLVSAPWVHEHLRRESPALLSRLYGDFIRDIVTPGGIRDLDQVTANRFPIFSNGEGLCFRYMRFWIERGHERCGETLDDEALAALDALDEALARPEATLTFRMAPGDFLWVDNTRLAHDRDAYRDAPNEGRLMLRLWLRDKLTST